MLGSLVLTGAALAFSPLPRPAVADGVATRRSVLALGAGAVFSVPFAASAAYDGGPNPTKVPGTEAISYQEKVKEYRTASRPVPGQENEAFKAAEAKRKAAASGQAIAKPTVNDDLARLGLKSWQ